VRLPDTTAPGKYLLKATYDLGPLGSTIAGETTVVVGR
jgi:hypothetical protein